MKRYNFQGWILPFWLFTLLGSVPLLGQHRIVTKSLSPTEYQVRIGAARNSVFAGFMHRIELGEINSQAEVLKLDLGQMLSNEALTLDLAGKRYPVIKSSHWIDPDDPEVYSVFGYMKGDKSLPFYYHRDANGKENLTFQSPSHKYYFTGLGDGWFMTYSYNPAFEGQSSCGEKDRTALQAMDDPDDGEAVRQNFSRAPGKQCKLRTVFLMTDQVEVGYTALKNALDQNIAYINSNILQNGNGRNPTITAYSSPMGCQFQIERVALLRTHQNSYDSYTEITCPTESNGNVMRDQMVDGLEGRGDLSWLQTLRKDYAADLIVMLTSNELRSSTRPCSESATLNGIAGGIGVGRNASVIVQRAVGTFLDNSHNPDASNLTLIHELGHNLGCSHEGRDATYQGYCDAAGLQKTIMHTLGGTAPCDGGVSERRAVFSHEFHSFADAAAAGSANHKNASRVGGNFESNAEFFEDGNSGSNDLTYYGDFNNNSGRLRLIDTPGSVVLSYARNSGGQFVKIQSAEYVYITGTFSSERISMLGIPNNASKNAPFVFDEEGQAEQLEQSTEAAEVDQLFAAKLWPNPAENLVNVAWFQTGEAAVHLAIYNSSGAKVQELLSGEMHPEGEQKAQFSIGELSSGLYIVQLQTGSEQVSFRLVKP